MTVAGVDAKFSAAWNNPTDFLARVGLTWSSTQTFDQLGTVSADFAHTKTGGAGYSFIGIYGWSVPTVAPRWAHLQSTEVRTTSISIRR